MFSINSNKQRSTSSNGADVEMRLPTTNKEKRKQVKSLPNSIPNNELKISQPVLVKRQTFTELFSAKEVNALGASPAQNPSLDDLVSKTIRRNLGDPYPMATSEQKVTEEEIPRTKSNPIPKPPRRGKALFNSNFCLFHSLFLR